MLNLHNHIAKPAPFDMVDNALKASRFSSTRDYLIYFWLLPYLQLLYVLSTFRKSLVNTSYYHGGRNPLHQLGLVPLVDGPARALPGLQTTLQFPNRLTVITYPLLLTGVAQLPAARVMAPKADKLRLRVIWDCSSSPSSSGNSHHHLSVFNVPPFMSRTKS